jgi:hypothetical protein
MAVATNVDVFLEGTVAGLALLLTLVAAASAKRVRSRRAALLALAFALLAVKGVLLLAGRLDQDPALSALDLGVLALLYAGMLAG